MDGGTAAHVPMGGDRKELRAVISPRVSIVDEGVHAPYGSGRMIHPPGQALSQIFSTAL